MPDAVMSRTASGSFTKNELSLQPMAYWTGVSDQDT